MTTSLKCSRHDVNIDSCALERNNQSNNLGLVELCWQELLGLDLSVCVCIPVTSGAMSLQFPVPDTSTEHTESQTIESKWFGLEGP